MILPDCEKFYERFISYHKKNKYVNKDIKFRFKYEKKIRYNCCGYKERVKDLHLGLTTKYNLFMLKLNDVFFPKKLKYHPFIKVFIINPGEKINIRNAYFNIIESLYIKGNGKLLILDHRNFVEKIFNVNKELLTTFTDVFNTFYNCCLMHDLYLVNKSNEQMKVYISYKMVGDKFLLKTLKKTNIPVLFGENINFIQHGIIASFHFDYNKINKCYTFNEILDFHNKFEYKEIYNDLLKNKEHFTYEILIKKDNKYIIDPRVDSISTILFKGNGTIKLKYNNFIINCWNVGGELLTSVSFINEKIHLNGRNVYFESNDDITVKCLYYKCSKHNKFPQIYVNTDYRYIIDNGDKMVVSGKCVYLEKCREWLKENLIKNENYILLYKDVSSL